ncbi:MAG: deoxyguanosinetriphosphate triphosphohydrolase [Firmicutes bacterium]|nr:deoxyguanosinetriphosphate triphosphohydrolase [Bacillota bacterium]MCL5039642.1 deoxyguanosinetriphosphate triphosphohydrolase [Bacillota bacterium]
MALEDHSSLSAKEEHLAPYATRSRDCQRKYREEVGGPDQYRLPFQRDRDRILYSSSFRRLQFKTQVYVVHEGDFYRTRMTHTLEVMQHARTIARALGLNEDLVEAISLAHDLGHPPFGHAGEEELDDLIKDAGGFDHNLQSLRIVDQLEKRYRDFPGLNLCFETREGLARHSTAFDNPAVPDEFKQYNQPSLESQVVDLADTLAYLTHDLEDALAARLVTMEQVRSWRIKILEESYDELEYAGQSEDSAADEIALRLFVRNLIHNLSVDAIEQTKKNIQRFSVRSISDVRQMANPLADHSPQVRSDLGLLKDKLLEEVYRHPAVMIMVEKGRRIIRSLYKQWWDKPALLPREVQECLQEAGDTKKRRILVDFISSLTDRSAMELYSALFEPHERVMRSWMY